MSAMSPLLEGLIKQISPLLSSLLFRSPPTLLPFLTTPGSKHDSLGFSVVLKEGGGGVGGGGGGGRERGGGGERGRTDGVEVEE